MRHRRRQPDGEQPRARRLRRPRRRRGAAGSARLAGRSLELADLGRRLDLAAGQLEFEVDALALRRCSATARVERRRARRCRGRREGTPPRRRTWGGGQGVLIRPVGSFTTGRIRVTLLLAARGECAARDLNCPADRGAKHPLSNRHLSSGDGREFRFGFGLHAAPRQSSVQDWARRAEDMGYDVLHVPDHLGAPAPFPTLMTAAAGHREAARGHLRAQRRVLQARPAGARRHGACATSPADASSSASAPATSRRSSRPPRSRIPSARERVDHLRHVIEYLGEHAPDVPILIAGNGDRLLTIAAQRADVIGLTGGDPITDGRPTRRADRVRAQRRRRALRRPRAQHRDHRDADRRLRDARPVDHPPVPARAQRRGTAADAGRAVRLDRATSPTRSAATATRTGSPTSPCSSPTPRRSRR